MKNIDRENTDDAKIEKLGKEIHFKVVTYCTSRMVHE